MQICHLPRRKRPYDTAVHHRTGAAEEYPWETFLAEGRNQWRVRDQCSNSIRRGVRVVNHENNRALVHIGLHRPTDQSLGFVESHV